ncbi:Redox-sensing transcriptional repressor Rex [Rubripirellula tenax]|uniref:Redox-sensing transcriptional repressor Rex n=1 Tax=Rubripirellula tenax TaxID=2528015 RepID=A0A5C6EBD3_9BACT|nr:redox-sensing transcriptional repressor Rex [Rubripirellula tenax]TWU46198.1 Redox-sensing transcriptional repressor Rex [Rubripirellula tenax]
MTDPKSTNDPSSDEVAAPSPANSSAGNSTAANQDVSSSPALPQPAIGRLSLYHRELHRLLETNSTNINSQQLGRLVNVSPPVVRRDLSALGTIGRRGVGYDVQRLIDRIGEVLGSGMQWKVVLVGVGSLGDALLRYRGFERLGFELSAAFDNAPNRIGSEIAGIKIRDAATIEKFLVDHPAELAILAVPAEFAHEIADRLVGCRVNGILNFAPTTLKLPPRVAVVNVDLASELQRLAFAIQAQR